MGNCLYSCLYFCQQFHELYIRDNKPVQIAIGVVSGALLMVILLAIFGAFRSTPCGTTYSEYNLFTKSWAQTICQLEETTDKKCRAQEHLPKNITIHGLWPRLWEKQTALRYCKDNYPFDASKLSTELRAQLDLQWPTVFEGHTNESFWHHEWNAHGTCTFLELEQYFENTVKFDNAYPIQQWLLMKGIEPTNENTINLEKLKGAFTAVINEDQFSIECADVKGDDGNMYSWLKNVILCVNWDAKSLTKCSEEILKSNCKDELYFIADRKNQWGPKPTVAPTESPTTTTSELPTTTTVQSTSTTQAPTTTQQNATTVEWL